MGTGGICCSGYSFLRFCLSGRSFFFQCKLVCKRPNFSTKSGSLWQKCVCVVVVGRGGWRHLNRVEFITHPFLGVFSRKYDHSIKHEFLQVLNHWLSNVVRIDCLRFLLIFGGFIVSCGFCCDCDSIWVVVVLCIFLLHLQHTVLYKYLQIVVSNNNLV